MSRLIAEMTDEERRKFALIIGDFAARAALLPPQERPAFINDAVARVRDFYREKHRDNADALVEMGEFVDQLERYIHQTVELLNRDR